MRRAYCAGLMRSMGASKFSERVWCGKTSGRGHVGVRGRGRLWVSVLLASIMGGGCTSGGMGRSANAPQSSVGVSGKGAARGSVPNLPGKEVCSGKSASAQGTPHSVGPWSGGVLGVSPAWAIGFSRVGHGAGIEILNGTRVTKHGYDVKVLWITAPGWKHSVMVEGSGMASGDRLWWQLGQGPVKRSLVLNPTRPGVPGSGDSDSASKVSRYAAFPSFMLLPGPGCFRMTASWPGGHWSRVFVARRPTS